MDKSPASVIRDEIRSIAAYHVPDSTGMVKLDAMENPYCLPSDLAQEVGRLASQASLNRYPDPTARALKVRLRQAMKVPDTMEILLGNGSDELIQILALAVNKPGAVLLGVEPSFVMFRMIASFVGLRYVGVPLTTDFGLDLPALQEAIRVHQPALTFLAYPNNPTGNLFDAAAVERVAELSPGLVVVDEAYHAFAGRSLVPQLAHYPNLLVMRTLSKLGLAGLRLGLLIGRADWVTELDKLRLPYNINVLTQSVAEYLLTRGDLLEKQAVTIREERGRLQGRLAALHGIRPFPSDANFILFRVANANGVFLALKSRGILIKNVSGSHPMLAECLRVTVGTHEENDKFLEALRESLPRAA